MEYLIIDQPYEGTELTISIFGATLELNTDFGAATYCLPSGQVSLEI